MTETKCPLCGLQRPRGAKRCLCNYTFEYERETGGFARLSRSHSSSPISVGILVVAAIAGVSAYFTMPSTAEPNGSMGLVLMACGLFAIAGGFFDWSLFMGNRRARKFVWLLGRGGARYFYGVLGGALIGAGAAL